MSDCVEEKDNDLLEIFNKFEYLSQYTIPLKEAEREIVGRDDEIQSILAAFARPELCNVILLGDAGSGKTALVQGAMLIDKERLYLEVNLSKMISDLKNPNEIADRLKSLFYDVESYVKETKHEIVLFIDEFHQIVQLSDAAVEVLKPLLADSGTRGIKVVAATTYDEFRKYISENLPLVERLQRMNVRQPDRTITIEILKGMVETYGCADLFYDESIFEMIYEYTQRYIPSSSQPRKSIKVLDSMIGWHKFDGRPIDLALLADVIYQSEGVNVTFRVDANAIKKTLDEYVYAQDFATTAIEQRLNICVADLNNKEKPMSSFLFTGSTGVGKALLNDEMIPAPVKGGFIRNGDLQIGDYIFDKNGERTKVLGVYPQGLQDVYEISFSDGRSIKCSGEHLWTYKNRFGNGSKNWKTITTKDLMSKGVGKLQKDGRVRYPFVIPMNKAVERCENDYKLDPYVLGAFIGNGCFTSNILEFSSNDIDVVRDIANILGLDYKQHKGTYSWNFIVGVYGSYDKLLQTSDILSECSDLIGLKSGEKFIPKEYKLGSIEQRWALIQGLFDTDGTIGGGNRYNVSYSTTSFLLAEDIQDVLFSLGISSSITKQSNKRDSNNSKTFEYRVHVKVENENKYKFFRLERKRKIALNSQIVIKKRIKKFDTLMITDIKKLDYQAGMTCIEVDNDEHLYQAGQYIVTHNTEVTKQLSKILFNDTRNLIRFDMTEYANEDSLERFRSELTARVWERPYSIILLDEIEKACSPVTRILLQVLDDGRLSDINGREVSFINSYIILTTNAGSEIYETIAKYNSDDDGSGEQLQKYNKVIRRSLVATVGENKFPPELLGRIDTIVPFQPLSEATMERIVKNKLLKLAQEVAVKHHIKVSFDKKVVQYLVLDKLDTDASSGGARAVVAKLEAEVTTAVSKFINRYPNVNHIKVKVSGDMASDNKLMLESQASIEVVAVQ